MARRAIPVAPTANDRFKRSWDQWLASGIIAAVGFHFAVFAFWPEMTAADIARDMTELEAIPINDKVDLPPPPEETSRPATPIIGDATIDENVTMEVTDFYDEALTQAPPPPESTVTEDQGRGAAFTPYEIPPRILNEREVQRALEREYPPTLRDSGIGATVRVWFYIGADGTVLERRVEESSDYAQFDEAALAVADMMEFSPAQNMDRAVAVAVIFPITFRVRQ